MADSAFYHAVRLASRPLLGLYFGLRREGAGRVPREGAAVLAANHVSYLDPAVVGSVVPRQVHFLMDLATWAHPSLNWFYRGMDAIPVDRTGGPTRDAFRAALARLEAGQCIGIFPEGARARAEGPDPAQLGVALIARMSGAPVVPVGIGGTEAAMPRGRALPEPARVRVLFGEPLLHAELAAREGLGKREADARFTELLMRSIDELAALARSAS